MNSKLTTPRMTFSPADSLDSNVTLVSAGLATEASRQQQRPPAGRHPAVASIVRNDAKGTTEKTYADGSLEVVYSNGNRKEVSADGSTTKVYYYNGDVKETLPSGLVKYFYSQTKTWHLTYPDGKEVLQFSK